MDISSLTTSADAAERRLKRIESEAKKATQNLANDADKQASAVASANKRIAQASNDLTQALKSDSRERVKALGLNTEVQRGRNISARGANARESEDALSTRQAANRRGRIDLEEAKGTQRRITAAFVSELRQRNAAFNTAMSQRARDTARIQAVIDRTIGAHPNVRGRVLDAVGGDRMARRRDSMVGLLGLTNKEALMEQLSARFNPEESRFLATGGARPFSLGGRDVEGIARAREEEKLKKEQDRSARETQRANQKLFREAERDAKQKRDFEEKRERDYFRLFEQAERSNNKVLAAEEKMYEKARTARDKQTAQVTRGLMRDEEKQGRQAQSNARRNFAIFGSGIKQDSNEIVRLINRSLQAPIEMQEQIAKALNSAEARLQRGQMRMSGMTSRQISLAQLSPVIGQQNAGFLVGGGRRPPAFGGTPPGGGGRGNILTRLLGMGGGGAAGGLVSSLAGGFGIGVGGYALAGGIRAAGEGAQRATEYDRQRLAAEQLAGSQEKLNALLAEYEESSGDAVDASTALANITRLLATGYADSVPEVERFVKATRGASIALGKPQDYVIQETQLAMSNTSFKRLDQIGLGISEVQERIKKLREENSGMTRETAFQIAVMDAMNDKFGQLAESAEGQATGLELLAKEWANLGLAMGQAIKEPLDDIAEFISEQLDRASDLIDKARQVQEDKEAWRLENDIKGNRGLTVDPFFQVDEDWNIHLRRRSEGRAFGGEPAHMADTHAAALALPPPTGSSTVNEERDAIKADYFDKFEELEKRTGEARIQLIEQYESQRADIIRNYSKSIAREEEDFARQRARGERDFQRSIIEMAEDAADREAEAQENLDEALADMREDANEKLADVEEKYNDDREKRERAHRDRLLKAAGQLDAIAILEERKRWKEENEEAEKAHNEQVDEIQESLAEQTEEAREAHAEQLQDAREADAKRLEDMRRNRAQQLADEDVDRGIRLTRQAEDHNEQLAEMDRQHSLRLSQLATQAAAERLVLEEEFALALDKTGLFIEGMTEKMLARDKLIEDWFDGFVDMIEARLLVQSDPGRYNYDPKTGPNIPLDYGSSLGYTPTASYSASGVGTTRDGDFTRFGATGNNITFQNGAIRVTTTEGFEERVADDVIERVIEYMEAL
jgi:hypothetical protein